MYSLPYLRAVELSRLVAASLKNERRFRAQLHHMQLEGSHDQGGFRGRRESAIARMKQRRGY